MDLSEKRKKDIKIDRETEIDAIFALLDEANTDLEDDIDNLMTDWDTEFVLEEGLENELNSNDEPSNLLAPGANYHVV